MSIQGDFEFLLYSYRGKWMWDLFFRSQLKEKKQNYESDFVRIFLLF